MSREASKVRSKARVYLCTDAVISLLIEAKRFFYAQKEEEFE